MVQHWGGEHFCSDKLMKYEEFRRYFDWLCKQYPGGEIFSVFVTYYVMMLNNFIT